MSADEAQILLRMNQWDSRRVQEAWFQDEGKVRDTVGLPLKDTAESPLDLEPVLGKRDRNGKGHSNPQAADGLMCRICYSDKDATDMVMLPCGHYFCSRCMVDFMEFEVQTGPGCSALQCPSAKCNCKLPESLVRRIAPEKCFEKFSSFMLRSFVDINRSCRWCPGAGCDMVVEYPGGGSIDVHCSCGEWFCFACGDEAHRPASCSDLKRWNVKNTAESENVTWIMANTKPCPKCGVNIEKNQGCNQ